MDDRGPSRGASLVWLQRINFALAIGVVIFSVILLWKWFWPRTDAQVDTSFPGEAGGEIFTDAPVPSRDKPFAVYVQLLMERDLFQPLSRQLQADQKALTENLPALTQRIKLIGILIDDDPKAVIEDLKGNQIHFLSEGETIETAQLRKIEDGKVVFMYNNELVEMTP